MSHSEYGQDKLVLKLLDNKRNGTFVEIGALDGILHSNSLLLERDYGWKGLIVEANPACYEAIAKNRPDTKKLNTAIWNRPGMVAFECFPGGLYGWSGIKEAQEPQHKKRIDSHIQPHYRRMETVSCMTLETALDSFGIKQIDYLSIDIEGGELKVLSVFPFSKYEIDVMGIEDNWNRPELTELITSNGFELIKRVGPDNIWRKKHG